MDDTTVVEVKTPPFGFGDKLAFAAISLVVGVAADMLLMKGYTALRFRDKVAIDTTAQVEQ